MALAFSIDVFGSGDAITVVALDLKDSDDTRTRAGVDADSLSDINSACGDDVRVGEDILSLFREKDLLRRGLWALDSASI